MQCKAHPVGPLQAQKAGVMDQSRACIPGAVAFASARGEWQYRCLHPGVIGIARVVDVSTVDDLLLIEQVVN